MTTVMHGRKWQSLQGYLATFRNFKLWNIFLYRELPSCLLQEFKYSTAESLDGTIVYADLDNYNGGGYVFRLKGSTKDLDAKLKTLRNQRWINNQTRAVILGIL